MTAPKPLRITACAVCSIKFETRRKDKRFCSENCRRKSPRAKRSPGSTVERGYGKEHKRLREFWRPHVQAGKVDCAKCGVRLAPYGRWDLGHNEDRTAYTGPECVPCNRRDGAIRGNRQRGTRRAVSPVKPAGTSRQW